MKGDSLGKVLGIANTYMSEDNIANEYFKIKNFAPKDLNVKSFFANKRNYFVQVTNPEN